MKTRKATQQETMMMEKIIKVLAEIYSNKSSDEFKSQGDIRKVSQYKQIERMLADLPKLKKFPRKDADELKTMFLMLHRPIFNRMVTEYLNKPNERNTLFTCLYTVAYRSLLGELSRIFASTLATDGGLVYKPDKVSRQKGMGEFIRAFNSDIDRQLDEYIRATYPKAYSVQQEGAVADIIDKSTDFVLGVLGLLPRLFRGARELNPISFINALLMRSYDKKVKKFEDISKLYEATKTAYEEYLRIPQNDRNRKIESKYKKNLDKYNIKMQNLKAEIDHYDQRSVEEAKETNSVPKPTPKTTTSDTGSSQPTDSSDDDFDF